jgi:ActR/RegA family two-component response regulator
MQSGVAKNELKRESFSDKLKAIRSMPFGFIQRRRYRKRHRSSLLPEFTPICKQLRSWPIQEEIALLGYSFLKTCKEIYSKSIYRLIIFQDIMADSKAKVLIVTENTDVNAHLASILWLKGMIPYKASNSADCLKKVEELNGKLDAVIMSDELAADRTAKLIIIIKKINLDTKILVIAGEDSAKTRILDYGTDEFSLKPMSSENVADKVFNLLVKTQHQSLSET